MIKYLPFLFLVLTACSTTPLKITWLIPATYDNIQWFNEGMVAVKRGGKWGYIDSTGKEVIALKYDEAGYFRNGLAIVEIKDKAGVINKQGQIVVPIKYTHIHPNCQWFILASIGEQSYMLNRQGKVMATFPKGCCNTQGGITFFWGNFSIDDGKLFYLKNDQWEIFNQQGQSLYPHTYEMVASFSEGMARVWNKAKRSAFIDSLGNQITPFLYESEAYARQNLLWNANFSEGLAKVTLNNKHGFINKKGKVVIPLVYHKVSSFENGRALVKKESSNGNIFYGYINPQGKVIVPVTYAYLSRIKHGAIRAQKEDKWGLLNTQGKALTPFIYDNMSDFDKGLIQVKLKGKTGFINAQGQTVISPTLDYYKVGDFREGLAKVLKDGVWGFIDRNGKEVIARKYDEVGDFQRGLATFTLNKKQGLINTKGEVVCPPTYHRIYAFYKKLDIAKIEKLDQNNYVYTGYINQAGKEIIMAKNYDASYDDYYSEGLLVVSKRGKKNLGYVDHTGKVVVPMIFKKAAAFKHGIARVAVLKKIEEHKNGFSKISYKKQYGFIKNPLLPTKQPRR